MKRLIPAFVIILSGCDWSGIFGSDLDPAEALRERHAQWEALGLHSYDFEFQNFCWCGEEQMQPVRIEVRDALVTRVINRDTGLEVNVSQNGSWPTVDSLFLWSAQRLGYGFRLEITFDPTYKFPTRIVGDIPNALDDEFTSISGNLIVRQ
jgi:hypothetical protein